MKTIRHILNIKGYVVWSVKPDTPVYDAIELMANKDIGALLVINDEKIVGMVSERDYARKVILKGRSSKTTKVREIMTPHVIFTNPDKTIEDCLELMTTKHIRHLPVFENDQLIGLVSIGDLTKAMISEQKRLISQLEKFILEYTSIT